jgi:hypothetical protein
MNFFSSLEIFQIQTVAQKSGLSPVVHFVLFLTFSRRASSVFVRLATRSLPYVRRGYFYFFSIFSCSAIALPWIRKKNKPPLLVLAVALPPAINLNRYAIADFLDLFRYRFTSSVAVTRSYPYTSLRKSFVAFPV